MGKFMLGLFGKKSGIFGKEKNVFNEIFIFKNPNLI